MDELALNGGPPSSPHRVSIAKPLIGAETLDAIRGIIETGQLRQGKYVKEFEESFAERTGAKYAYAVNNGTAALHVAYLSTVKQGDEVIVPSFTFLATASMAYYTMAKPVFADIDPDTFLIDLEDVKSKITRKTRAIVPVHLFGNAADIAGLQDLCEDHHLRLIHDSAQAHGTMYDGRDLGSLDDLGCYSFYPSKTLTTGEGGMVTTNDHSLYRKGTLLRAHGDDARYHHILMGFNYRLTEIAAVLGLEQMSRFDEFLRRRKQCAAYLKSRLGKVEGLCLQQTSPRVDHSYSYYSLTMDPEQYTCSRDQFIKALAGENIECAVHYPTPLTRQPIILEKMDPAPCPVSEYVSRHIFSLPMHPALTDLDLENIVAGVEKVSAYYHR